MNKITKLVGLKKIDFDQFVKDGKITISKTRLLIDELNKPFVCIIIPLYLPSSTHIVVK